MTKYFWLIAVCLLITVPACAPKEQPEEPRSLLEPIDGPEDAMTLAPYVDVEATVMEITPIACISAPCLQGDVKLKIDVIDRSGDRNTVINLEEGEESQFFFKYGTDRVKLKMDIPPHCRPRETLKDGSCFSDRCEGADCAVSSPEYDIVQPEEADEFIIFHLPETSAGQVEKDFPGVEVGSKIKFRMWEPQMMNKEIDAYEVIS